MFKGLFLVFFPFLVCAQQVWNGANGTVVFAKANNADWTQAANQDRITDSVWITRASSQSLFNIRKETAYGPNAPRGTMWAFGTTDSFATLAYTSFVTLSNGNPQSLIGKPLVLKLVAENIFIDITFNSYSGGSNSGGGFSYTRAASVPMDVRASGTAVRTFDLLHNHPNPFNPMTTVGFTLERSGMTTLKVYDAAGREVATLVNGHREAGVYHQVQFDGLRLASGIYYARLTNGGNAVVRNMMLLK